MKPRYIKKEDEAWTDDQYNDFVEFALHSNDNAENIRSQLNHNKKPMSIWNTDEMNVAETNPNSLYINKALGKDDSIKLTLISIKHEDQREDTPDLYRTPDGKEWILYFTDEEGKERQMAQRSLKGRLIQALRDNDIQPDDKIIVTRTGIGKDETDYTVTKGWDAVVEEKKTDIPF